jgi:DNA mismatch endonuclease (patch repair protein)
MVDTLTAAERSARMALVRSRDTKPEMIVRRLIHSLGFRYRLHVRVLPGAPDLVFPRLRKVIFVHGCFWHRHSGCSLCRLPKSRLEFWQPKLEGNRLRDSRQRRELKKLGWRSLVIWECQVARIAILERKVKRFLCAPL